MELQCYVGIKSKAEVIIENIQRKLQWWTKAEVKLCVIRQKEKTTTRHLSLGKHLGERLVTTQGRGCLYRRNRGFLNLYISESSIWIINTRILNSVENKGYKYKLLKWKLGVPVVVHWVKNLTSIHEDVGSSPGLTQWVKDHCVTLSSCVGHRCDSHLVLLWLWCKLAAAAPIRPLAWKLPYATNAALKRPNK